VYRLARTALLFYFNTINFYYKFNNYLKMTKQEGLKSLVGLIFKNYKGGNLFEFSGKVIGQVTDDYNSLYLVEINKELYGGLKKSYQKLVRVKEMQNWEFVVNEEVENLKNK
jgi:hypothetical protein